MLDRLERAYRILATGFCFAMFGLGGVLIGVLAYPAICLLTRDRTHRALHAKKVVHQSFRLFVGLMATVGVISYEVRGRERLQRNGLLVVANHPSLIDVVFLVSLIDRADCIVRGGLARNPFTRGPIAAAGYVSNDSGPGMVDECIASIRSGNNLVIFPEGTRTPLQGGARLQRGAANIAVRGGIDMTPVRISSDPPMLRKGVPWYRVPVRRAHFVIEVCEDIPVRDFSANNQSEALAARQLTDFLAQYYSREISRAQS